MAGNTIREMTIGVLFNSKQAEKGIEEFQGKVKSLGKAIVAAVSVKEVFQDFTELATLSEKFKLPTEEVTAFSNLMAAMGASTDETINALYRVGSAIDEFRTTSGGPLAQVASQIGLDLTDDKGRLKSAVELITDLRDSLKGINEAGQRTVLSQLGLDDPAFWRYLTGTNEEIEEYVNKTKDMYTADQEVSESVLEMTKSWNLFKTSLTRAGMEIVDSSAPALTLIIDTLDTATMAATVFGRVIALSVEQLKALGDNSIIKFLSEGFDFAAGGIKQLYGFLVDTYEMNTQKPFMRNFRDNITQKEARKSSFEPDELEKAWNSPEAILKEFAAPEIEVQGADFSKQEMRDLQTALGTGRPVEEYRKTTPKRKTFDTVMDSLLEPVWNFATSTPDLDSAVNTAVDDSSKMDNRVINNNISVEIKGVNTNDAETIKRELNNVLNDQMTQIARGVL